MAQNMNKINVKALAIALGAVWSLGMVFIGVASMFGWLSEFAQLLATAYIGFGPTFGGVIIGAIWGFVDGATGGAAVAFVYNIAAQRWQ